MMSRLCFLGFLVFLTNGPASGQPIDVLFIGNSLTYTNDLPLMVRQLGKTVDKKIRVTALCFANYALEDHWQDGDIQELLASGRFEYVLFQQGPSSQAYGRNSLLKYGGLISELARKSSTTPAYLMVWPAVQYYHTFPGVIANHEEAAQKKDALLIPAGKAWQHYRTGTFNEDLYGPDQFHPSATGTLLTALTVVQVLFPDLDPEQIPYRKVDSLGVTEATWERICLSVREILH